jgi:glyoxylate reductase
MKEKDKIIITSAFPEELIAKLRTKAEVISWKTDKFDLMPRAKVLACIHDAIALINVGEIAIDKELLDNAGRLKIVSNVAIGYDNVDMKALAFRKIWLTNTPDFFAYPVVEIVIAGMICVSRRLIEVGNFVRSGKWENFEPGRWDGKSLKNKTLGIVGYGKIGHYLKPIAEAFGMKVICYDRNPNANEEYCSFDELLTNSDFVSLHVPLSPENKGLFNKRVFRKMKKGAIFINASRGAVMKECDLVSALVSGHLGGAVLDVYENEPTVSPELLAMENVFLTSHVGGGTVTSRYKSQELATENVLAVLEGKRPLTPVNEIV